MELSDVCLMDFIIVKRFIKYIELVNQLDDFKLLNLRFHFNFYLK